MHFSRWWQLKDIFIFTPKLGEDEPILRVAYFSKGLVETTNKFLFYLREHRKFVAFCYRWWVKWTDFANGWNFPGSWGRLSVTWPHPQGGSVRPKTRSSSRTKNEIIFRPLRRSVDALKKHSEWRGARWGKQENNPPCIKRGPRCTSFNMFWHSPWLVGVTCRGRYTTNL